MSHVILEVPDISCGHCERTILTALQGRAGVETVQVSLPAKTVALSFDESTLPLAQVEAFPSTRKATRSAGWRKGSPRLGRRGR